MLGRLEVRSRAADLLVASILAVAIALAYGRVVSNDFTYDDFTVLVRNPGITQLASPLAPFTDASTQTTADLVRAYRPLRTLLFAAEHRFFGDDAAPYHVVSLVLHFLAALLVWFVLRPLLPGAASVFAATVFAVHPLGTEVVASIKSQDDLMAALAVLGAVLLFRRHIARPRPAIASGTLLLLYAVGMLSKEGALVLPALLLVVWIASRPEPGALRRAPWKLLLAMGLMAAAFLAWRGHVLAATGRPAAGELAWLFPSSVAHVPLYLLRFVWPSPLTIDYSFLPLHPTAWLLAGSLVLQAALVWMVWRSRDAGLRFGLAWFYVTLLPSLNLIGSYYVFAERFAYLPLLGMAVMAVAAVRLALKRWPLGLRSRLVPIAAVAVLIVLGTRTADRAADWKDDETLFRAALAVHPDSDIMTEFLVTEMLDQGRQDEARRLLASRPQFAGTPPRSAQERSAYAQEAILALRLSDDARAARILAVVVDSPFARWNDWLNLGSAYLNLGRYDEARGALRKALALNGRSLRSWVMLGRIAMKTGDPGEALRCFTEARKIDPQDGLSAYLALYVVWRTQGDDAACDYLAAAVGEGCRLGKWLQGGKWWRQAGPRLQRAVADELRRCGLEPG